MDEVYLAAVAEAFSRKAGVYDAFGENHPLLQRMREKVRRHVLRHLQPEARILEMNAGSGSDAVFFAAQGYTVHATDLAPGMVSKIEEKAIHYGLIDRLSCQRLDFHRLDLARGAPFDYIFSNLGGVNCAVDLPSVARATERVLTPGGRLTWVVMPPICLWELAQALRLNFRFALRRLKPNGVQAHVEGVYFTTRYYSPNAVRAAFGAQFQVLELEGLSVFTPPADHKDFAHRRPRLYAALAALDDRLARRAPFNRWGDFYIITLQRGK